MEGVSPKEVDRMLRRHLRGRSDLGFWKAVEAKILEPQNPFGPPTRRKTQRWFVLFLIVWSAAIVAFVYFNSYN
jgi:hypothetical protein